MLSLSYKEGRPGLAWPIGNTEYFYEAHDPLSEVQYQAATLPHPQTEASREAHCHPWEDCSRRRLPNPQKQVWKESVALEIIAWLKEDMWGICMSMMLLVRFSAAVEESKDVFDNH